MCTPPTGIYTLSLHDALPISRACRAGGGAGGGRAADAAAPAAVGRGAGGAARAPPHRGARRCARGDRKSTRLNSSHMSISYAVFCLKKKKQLSEHALISDSFT